MENDFEISIENNENTVEPQLQLPINCSTVGTIGKDDVHLYCNQNVFWQIETFAATDSTKELGGILIGNYRNHSGKTDVIITDFIEANYTDATAASLTFTHDTWDDIHAKLTRLDRNKKIIGWQHTHPGYGIFLSAYDLFIQQNFFDLPFQVAYVVDPISKANGFFQWKNGKIENLNGFYLFDDAKRPIVLPKKQSKHKKLIARLCILLTAVCFLFAFALFFRHQKEKELPPENTIVQIDQRI
jgi:Mov34/MPN/PAD-1 family.